MRKKGDAILTCPRQRVWYHIHQQPCEEWCNQTTYFIVLQGPQPVQPDGGTLTDVYSSESRYIVTAAVIGMFYTYSA